MNGPIPSSLAREMDPRFEPEGPVQTPSDFYRIKRLPPYVFEQVNRLKAQLRAQGADVIDLGMGNPDMPPPPHVIEKLVETARKPDTHGYSSSKGVPGLRRAIAGYYKRRWAPRRASPTWPRRSPRRAMWCCARTRPIRSTPSAS
jgi:DNA-binding transcriptional MocR family regulator